MKKILLLGVGMLMIAIAGGYIYMASEAEARPLPPLKSFYYSYHGTERFPLREYTLKKEDGQIFLILDEENTYATQMYAVSQEELDELHKLLEEVKIQEWNGFHGSNPDILDGYSFELYIQFEDGTHLHASGSNDYPKGFREKEKRFEDFFEKYRTVKE